MKAVDGRHLSDDQMIAVSMDAESPRHTEEALDHLSTCEACLGRYEQLARELAALRDAAHEEADAVFTPARLEAQRAHILARLEHLGHPARVIPFPAHAERRLAIFTGNQLRRWTAVAAAAGLIIGVGVGRLVDVHPTAPRQAPQAAIQPAAIRPAYQRPPGEPTTRRPNDEEMLSRSLYLQQVGDLQDFDEATPHVVALKIH